MNIQINNEGRFVIIKHLYFYFLGGTVWYHPNKYRSLIIEECPNKY